MNSEVAYDAIMRRCGKKMRRRRHQDRKLAELLKRHVTNVYT
jgi:hypothetical protein